MANPVVLLHGLGRTGASMLLADGVLRRQGLTTHRHHYWSHSLPLPELARREIPLALQRAAQGGYGGPVDFVAHSMGGILLRQWALDGDASRIGRVVMLGPPNRGSEWVEVLSDTPLAPVFLGPSGRSLGRGANSLPRGLPAVPFETGVIAGDRALNPISRHVIGRASDGKVAVDAAAVDGMADFITLPVGHTMMMNDPRVLAQAAHFLRHGRFKAAVSALHAVRELAGLA